MRTSNSTISIGVLLLLGVVAPLRAAADTLQRHVARADQLYAERRYDAALTELQAAYKINPLPSILYNLSQTYRNLQRPREALEHLDLYLSGANGPKPEQASKIREQQRTLRAALRDQCAAAEREGAAALSAGDSVKARTTLARALAAREYLQRSEPSEVQYQRDLVISHLRLAKLELEQRDLPASRSHCAAAEAVLLQIEQAGTAADDPLLRKMRQQLTVLKLAAP